MDTKLATIMTILEERLPERVEKKTQAAAMQTEGEPTYSGDHSYTDEESSLGITYMLVDNQHVSGAEEMNVILDTIVGDPAVSLEPLIATNMDEYDRLDL